MIKVNELRIGNHISSPRGEFEIVEIGVRNNNYYAAFNGLHECYYLEDCDPILITEEILLKCGFEETYRSDFVQKIESNIIVQITWGRVLKLNNGIISACETVFPHIKYLHQLQNLYFALTGKELEVEL